VLLMAISAAPVSSSSPTPACPSRDIGPRIVLQPAAWPPLPQSGPNADG
jgi:hypothetical protein